jgi:hypothetical protein
VCVDEDIFLRDIERLIKRQIPSEVVPGFEPLDTPPIPVSGGGGIKGKRPSKKDKLRALAPPSQP